MPEYRIRLVAEAGPDPVNGVPRRHDEETLTVEADTPWNARSRALHRMGLRPSGRLLKAYDADTGAEIVHPPPTDFRPGLFVIDGLVGTYEGFTRRETWNGFAVPYFPLAEARRVANDYAAQPAGLDGRPEAEYDAGRDVVRLYDPSSGEWEEYGPELFEDGPVSHTLYPIGARFWTWEEVGERRTDSE